MLICTFQVPPVTEHPPTPALCEVGAVLLILRGEKRLRKVTTVNNQSWDLDAGSVTPKPTLLTLNQEETQERMFQSRNTEGCRSQKRTLEKLKGRRGCFGSYMNRRGGFLHREHLTCLRPLIHHPEKCCRAGISSCILQMRVPKLREASDLPKATQPLCSR